jgi:hypothetical protein
VGEGERGKCVECGETRERGREGSVWSVGRQGRGGEREQNAGHWYLMANGELVIANFLGYCFLTPKQMTNNK